MSFKVEGLPQGLTCNKNGVLTGVVSKAGNYSIIVTVSNKIGSDIKNICLEIADDNILLTPLLGFTSWNAFLGNISQDKILNNAQILVNKGISEYGYSYVNIDSGWQGKYGGLYNAILPNESFPDMKSLCGKIHEYGLKCGIYSTPMLNAWGLDNSSWGLPGCTRGERDVRFSDENCMGGVGKERLEKNNVNQWSEWGFDYLKYDWRPCDTENATIMKKCLIVSQRDFAYCITVNAEEKYANYWKTYCTSWRDNPDSQDDWNTLLNIFNSCDKWSKHVGKGHFFDLDMLEIGYMYNHRCYLTEDEQIVAYSMRAIFPSPIQISCQLDKLNDFETALLCNEEIISINQDSLTKPAYVLSEDKKDKKHIKIYKKELDDGNYAVGIFNLGETKETVNLNLEKICTVRDLWAKENILKSNKLSFDVMPHTAKMLKILI